MAPSSDKNDQAVQIMINRIFGGEPINAQEAMELTGRFSLAEIKQKNFADNVRARAKREYGDMCELNQALQPWDEVFPRKRSRSNSPVPPAGASLSENLSRSRSNSQELPERLLKTKIVTSRSRLSRSQSPMCQVFKSHC
jgi:hypothetical protein